MLTIKPASTLCRKFKTPVHGEYSLILRRICHQLFKCTIFMKTKWLQNYHYGASIFFRRNAAHLYYNPVNKHSLLRNIGILCISSCVLLTQLYYNPACLVSRTIARICRKLTYFCVCGVNYCGEKLAINLGPGNNF